MRSLRSGCVTYDTVNAGPRPARAQGVRDTSEMLDAKRLEVHVGPPRAHQLGQLSGRRASTHMPGPLSSSPGFC